MEIVTLRTMRKIIFICLLSALFCCKEQNKKEINNDKKITEITLKKQLEKGHSGVYDDSFDVETYTYTKIDLDASLPILAQILKKNNYFQIDDQKFKNKVQKIFGRLIDPTSNKYVLCVNFEDKCSRDFFLNRNDNSIDIKPFRIYIIKNQNFITELYAIPEITNYQKDFPDLIEFEKQIPKYLTQRENYNITISKWKDITDLAEQRTKNISILVNRNKYLFNDNKASFVWLKTHDKFFLESLVKTFGYVKDKDLLKWVLEKNLLKNGQDNVNEFAKILWTRNCDNKIEVRKEVFDFMLMQNDIEREKYATSLLLFRDSYKNTVNDLNFSELTKIRALVCYYGTKMNDNYFYSFFPQLNSEKYAEEFKKNNYYNISDFKELYEDAKYGGINGPY